MTKSQKTLSPAKGERIQYLDILRVISMFSVMTGNILFFTIVGEKDLLNAPTTSNLWHISALIDAIFFTLAIGPFIMISSALLTKDDSVLDIKYLFKKRILKMFIPLVFWSVIALTINALQNNTIPFSNISFSLYNRPSYYHLGFLFIILTIYLLLPMLRVFLANAPEKVIKYALVLWFVYSVLDLLGQLNASFQLPDTQNLNFLGGILGFYVLGFYLSRTEKKYSTAKSIVTFFVCVIGYYILYYFMLKQKNTAITTEYANPFSIIGGAAAFIIIKNIFSNKILSDKASKIIVHLSKLSFGVFLVNGFVVDLLNQFVAPLISNLYVRTLLMWIASLLISYVIVLILSRIKYVSNFIIGVPYASKKNAK